MGLKSQKILGIKISISRKNEILEYLKKSLSKTGKTTPKTLVITTPNPEQLVYAKANPWFAKILNQADVALPDGMGVALALGIPRIAGIEFMEDLVKLAVKRGVPIALIGGRGKIAVEAFECLSRQNPGLKGWAVDPDLSSLADLAGKIRTTGTRLVFVGLGAPKQELFIHELVAHYPLPGICMSVGGSFDILAGRLKRAPLVIRLMGFEWAWRLFQEPWRWRRQLALWKFIWLHVTKV